MSPPRLFPALVASLFLLIGPEPAPGQVCAQTSTGPTVDYADDLLVPSTSPLLDTCSGARCYPAEEIGARFEPDGACDPTAGSCSIKAIVYAKYPGNIFNSSSLPGDSMTKIYWSFTSDPQASNFAICGNPGGRILGEAGASSITAGNFSCSNPDATSPVTYYVGITTCANPIVCPIPRKIEVKFTPEELRRQLCPRMNSCSEGDRCPQNCLGPEGATSPAEGSPGFGPPWAGPGATLRYAANGVGRSNNPQPASWVSRLGRFWSHDYAEAIVQAPGVAHVWLLTRWATYREFTDGNNDGFYETVSPSDEKRRLEKVVSGWKLTGLDGTVDAFDSSGRWSSRTDRFGNAIVGSYDVSNRLTEVAFPDGRHEEFGYDGGGRLTSIKEVGIDGSTSREWGYVWTDDLLTRIDRPDDTQLEYFYSKTFPGFMTRMTLRGNDGTSTRVLAAWEYDATGRVSKAWKGATASDSTSAVDKWSFAYDDTTPPELVTTVTDPLGVASTFAFGRDSVSAKPKILQLSGDCPTCGSGPNTTFTYGDAANPMQPTRVVDGRGLKTDWVYDPNGMVIERTRAAETALERTETFEYDGNFPALMIATERPSTTGGRFDVRRTEFAYDGAGRMTGTTIEGFESGSAFSFTTVYTPTTEGKVATIDPPGYTTIDQTTFTYDSDRGNLLPLTQTEPLIGTTSFGYDAFNRKNSSTDVNGVETETTYDALNRVLTSTRKGLTVGEDLVTESRYNVFGDLFQTVLPRGNVMEYGYDSAGRTISMERKPDDLATSHGERTFLTLNTNGQKIKEELQSWNGSSWTTKSQTAWQYSTRCHVDKITNGLPTEQSVTEMAYDCNGNLEKVWDANHPSMGQMATPSTSYTYDSLNRQITQRQPFGGALGGNSDTSYSYDVQDNQTQVIDANGTVTSYVYSDRGLRTSEVSEVSGTTSWTYNSHGKKLTETDARSIVKTNTVDAYDRITFVDLPGTSLDTTYTYDDPLVPFAKGRLTKISRTDSVVEYGYDRFGRTIEDGDMHFTRDKNGNAVTVSYRGAFVTSYTFDFADRPLTLSATPSEASTQTIVSATSYRPGGSVSSLTLGNGLVETREYDSRNYAKRIFVPGKFDWGYTNDASGNPTAIVDALNGSNNRTFAYQDYQYYTTAGNGPWGTRSWSYDKIGNRLTEVRGAVTDTYSYVANAAAGRSPKISQISLGGGGTRTFTYDAAGNETQAGSTARTIDDAGKLSHLGNSPISMTADFAYDGRGYLAKSRGNSSPAGGTGIFCDGFESGGIGAWGGAGSPCFESPITYSTFGSGGTLYSTERGYRLSHVLYFGSRPVALVESPRVQTFDDEEIEITESIPVTKYRFLTTDKIGTPILATSVAAATLWNGGFEPFGADWNDAQAAGVFLRLPGQWVDPVWSALSGADTLFQNVNRWYEPGTGTYASADPAKMAWSIAPAPLSYVHGRPLVSKDPSGLWTLTDNCRAQGCSGCGIDMTGITVARGRLQACKLSKEAQPGTECRRAIDALATTLDKKGDVVVDCMQRLNCTDIGGATLDCEPCNGQCGDTIAYRTVLGGVTNNKDCPAGRGLGYGPTIFHESLHVCEISSEPVPKGQLPIVMEQWRAVEKQCTGWEAPIYNN